eukprot:CFRG0760T1
MEKTSELTIGEWVKLLGQKKPIPGGGAAGAVAAAIGAASGAMAAVYTTRAVDEKKGVAEKARKLAQELEIAAAKLIDAADDDAAAYARLQLTWQKKSGLSAEEVHDIRAAALRVPTDLLKCCYDQAVKVNDFLPSVNKNIRSDACVALHLLAGAAHAAYATVLVNEPTDELKVELTGLLRQMRAMESCTDTA